MRVSFHLLCALMSLVVAHGQDFNYLFEIETPDDIIIDPNNLTLNSITFSQSSSNVENYGLLSWEIVNFVLIDSADLTRRQNISLMKYSGTRNWNSLPHSLLYDNLTVLKKSQNEEDWDEAETCQVYGVEQSLVGFFIESPFYYQLVKQNVFHFSLEFDKILKDLERNSTGSTPPVLVCERVGASLKIRKCCSDREILDNVDEVCVPKPVNISWRPYIVGIGMVKMPIKYETGDCECQDLSPFDFKWAGLGFNFSTDIPIMIDGHRILPALHHPNIDYTISGQNVVLTPVNYCFDYTVMKTKFVIPPGLTNNPNLPDEVVQGVFRFCGPRTIHDHYQYRLTWVFYVVAALQFLTVSFLSLTIATFLILWRSQTVHSWIRFSFTLAQFLRVCVNILRYTTLALDRSQHYALFCTNFIQYLDLFTFYLVPFWLTSLTFDMLSGFWNPLKRRARQLNSFIKFGYFFAFSLLGPGLMVGIHRVIFLFLDHGLKVSELKACPQMNDLPFGSIFFYTSEAVLFILNVSILGTVVWILRMTEAEIKRGLSGFSNWTSNDSGNSTRELWHQTRSEYGDTKEIRKSCGVGVRLLFLLGVQWAVEICRIYVLASKYLLTNEEMEYDIKQYFFILMYSVEFFNGITVLVAFICTDSVHRQLTAHRDSLNKSYPVTLKEEKMKYFSKFCFRLKFHVTNWTTVWVEKGICSLILRVIEFNFMFNSYCFGCKNGRD